MPRYVPSMKAVRYALRKCAFSLVEVLAVIAAVAVISSLGYVAVTNTQQAAAASKLQQDVESLNRSVQIYLSSGGTTNGMTGADDGDPNHCDVLTVLKTAGATGTIGTRGRVVDARITADWTNGGSATRLRARWVPSTDPTVPPRFVLEQSTSGIMEFPMDDRLAATAATTANRTGARVAGTDGWVWNRGADADTTQVASAYTPMTDASVNSSLAALLSHPNLTGGVSIVGPSGTVTTENKYYDGAGYRGELGIFSLDGMGNPPYDLTTAAGLKAFMQEAVRRVAAGGTEGGVAMDRDGHGRTLNFNPGTAVAFILIPNNSFQAVDDMSTFPVSTSSNYPLTSLSFDTGNVAGFSQSQAVSLGNESYAIEDMAGGGDQDYEDIIWKSTGLTQPDWSTMREVDASTYYTNWDNPQTTTVENVNLLNRSGDPVIDPRYTDGRMWDPTLREAFEYMGVLP
jgi:prepilin-type N-terminal cleavage/methylation domain-containing protein